MPYIMQMYVDGGCRRNGYSNAIGAAACVLIPRWGKNPYWTRKLPSYPAPTSQRAELTAVILALETAWDKYMNLDGDPKIQVTIHVDSKYALGCMTEWRDKWEGNGFINSAGNEVANRDLIEEAYRLEEKVANEGWVQFLWIPRSENESADEEVNKVLDGMDNEGDDDNDYSSDDYSSDGYES